MCVCGDSQMLKLLFVLCERSFLKMFYWTEIASLLQLQLHCALLQTCCHAALSTYSGVQAWKSQGSILHCPPGHHWCQVDHFHVFCRGADPGWKNPMLSCEEPIRWCLAVPLCVVMGTHVEEGGGSKFEHWTMKTLWILWFFFFSLRFFFLCNFIQWNGNCESVLPSSSDMSRIFPIGANSSAQWL